MNKEEIKTGDLVAGRDCYRLGVGLVIDDNAPTRFHTRHLMKYRVLWLKIGRTTRHPSTSLVKLEIPNE
jgi:hypothetical protein